jgi:hypothetical protein
MDIDQAVGVKNQIRIHLSSLAATSPFAQE